MALTKAAVAVAALFAAALAPLATPSPTAAQAADLGAIVFQDDFTGTAGSLPDRTKWEDYSTATYNSSAAFGEIKPGDNETLDGQGNLVLPATPTAGSAIRTGAKFGFVYGTMSAWIKMPPQAGYWPAFWSLNNNPNGVDVFPIGEADTMEGYTTWNNVYHAVGHTWTAPGTLPGAGSPDNYCPNAQDADLSGRFNKYSATIEPGKITYYFNDVQCAQAYVKDPAKQWGFGPDVTRPNWLILDLAVGGADGQQTPASQPAQMLVDRVEVRALPGVAAPVVPVPVTPAPIVSGAVYELANACGGKVAEVPAASVTVERARVRTGTDTNAPHQRWRVVALPGGFYKLVNLASGKVLRLQSTSTAPGVRFVQSSDASGPNAQFTLTNRGGDTYQLLVRTSGRAVNVTANSASAGAVIAQAVPSSTACGQRWQLTKVG
ncbi:1,3-(1,3;1,4)-beta-D-glucan 3(4)-glucanohydrolase [Modestobacter italicus]|uniref:1,3-(1,31,4)-beta-D-glucan 3(4)-glucanohydrolase n=1 Tax=Modestobacter italicus (strain DSM 44449 / CECT 9708 / BC 501) TaxID=2732864 RepID=I4ERB8_MODI5|nr:RICIN domain-containing protein [Modestobacter marinus]CCH85931.1 1,3-(1,3;1,4)-beta-D-glucan 3(4)-glucanohydrolase [Modestobacter marinus]